MSKGPWVTPRSWANITMDRKVNAKLIKHGIIPVEIGPLGEWLDWAVQLQRWSVVDTEGHLMANELTGTYYGRSQAHKPRHTDGVLFSTDLATNKRAHYHCINWNEL